MEERMQNVAEHENEKEMLKQAVKKKAKYQKFGKTEENN